MFAFGWGWGCQNEWFWLVKKEPMWYLKLPRWKFACVTSCPSYMCVYVCICIHATTITATKTSSHILSGLVTWILFFYLTLFRAIFLAKLVTVWSFSIVSNVHLFSWRLLLILITQYNLIIFLLLRALIGLHSTCLNHFQLILLISFYPQWEQPLSSYGHAHLLSYPLTYCHSFV